jgi:hypothetical protein
VIASNSSSRKAPPNQELTSVQEGLRLLRQARELALASGSDVWDFAVEIGEVYAIGVTNAVLRWLIRQGHVEHRVEVTGRRSRRRQFRGSRNLGLGGDSCFVLTEGGAGFAADGRSLSSGIAGEENPRSSPTEERPHWDEESRRLSYRGFVIKEYRGRPGNQEKVLAVFQEEGWPPRVDDPLPPAEGVDATAHLRDTLRRLNRSQRRALLWFEADGRGGILWFALDGKERPRGAHAPAVDKR